MTDANKAIIRLAFRLGSENATPETLNSKHLNPIQRLGVVVQNFIDDPGLDLAFFLE